MPKPSAATLAGQIQRLQRRTNMSTTYPDGYIHEAKTVCATCGEDWPCQHEYTRTTIERLRDDALHVAAREFAAAERAYRAALAADDTERSNATYPKWHVKHNALLAAALATAERDASSAGQGA